jgi:hypothetical protein
LDELSDATPTERRGDALPAGDPANLAPAEGDCPAEVPAEIKDQAAAAHGNHEPPDSPIRAGELV